MFSQEPKSTSMKHFPSMSRMEVLRSWFACLIVTLVAADFLLRPTLARKSKSGPTRTILRIEAFQNCPDRPNTTEYMRSHNYLSKVNILRVKMDQYINAEYVVNRPVDSVQAVSNILKCQGVAEASCEHMLRLKVSLCDKLTEKGQIWSPLVETIQPPIRCPMNKPMYRVINGSFSTIAGLPHLAGIPKGFDYYWGAKVTYADSRSNSEAGCLYISFKFYKVKT